jgi:hypothetical protein
MIGMAVTSASAYCGIPIILGPRYPTAPKEPDCPTVPAVWGTLELDLQRNEGGAALTRGRGPKAPSHNLWMKAIGPAATAGPYQRLKMRTTARRSSARRRTR